MTNPKRIAMGSRGTTQHESGPAVVPLSRFLSCGVHVMVRVARATDGGRIVGVGVEHNGRRGKEGCSVWALSCLWLA